MRGVALRPSPRRLVTLRLEFQFNPQVLIHHRLLAGRDPSLALPTVNPLRDPLHHILRIRSDIYLTQFFEHRQALNGRHQLHAVIRGLRFRAPQFLFVLAKANDAGPTAWTRVANASPVGDQFDVLHAAANSTWKNSSTI